MLENLLLSYLRWKIKENTIFKTAESVFFLVSGKFFINSSVISRNAYLFKNHENGYHAPLQLAA